MLVDLFNELEDYMLTIIGAGPLEHELKRKAKNIIFEGEISNKEIRKYIESNDCSHANEYLRNMGPCC